MASAAAAAAACAVPAVRPTVRFGMASSVEEKLQLITRNLDEVMGGDAALSRLRSVLEQRDLSLYWGTATTGAPHIAYFVPMSKLADFLRAGCSVTVLFADLHAFLDNLKAPWERLQHRSRYYEQVIAAMLRAIGVPLDKLRFIRGTEFQLTKEYTLDMYKLATMTTERNAKKAGAEVVKQVASPLLSGMLYPLLQALDEEYLKVDAQFGGVDQRRIFTLAEKALPALGYGKRLHLMNPMVPGLQGTKMSSSEAASKIDLLDSREAVQSKIRQAFCEEGKAEGNGVLAFVRMVLFPLNPDGFTIHRKPEHGGSGVFATYAELEAAFVAREIHPKDLKQNVTDALNELLEPIRQHFQQPEMQELIALAYPPESKTELRHAAAALDDDDDHVQDGATAAKTGAQSAEAESKATPAPAAAAGAGKTPADTEESGLISKLDIRVGRVLSVSRVANSSKLFAVQADVGQAEPLPVVSRLVSAYSEEQLTGRLVCLLCNLKPAKLAGVKSLAMILAAESADGALELLTPPDGARVGERVGCPPLLPCAAANPPLLTVRANEKVQKEAMAQLLVNGKGEVCFSQRQQLPLSTTAGAVTVATLRQGATISWGRAADEA